MALLVATGRRGGCSCCCSRATTSGGGRSTLCWCQDGSAGRAHDGDSQNEGAQNLDQGHDDQDLDGFEEMLLECLEILVAAADLNRIF
jgi:hypothetical protein